MLKVDDEGRKKEKSLKETKMLGGHDLNVFFF